MQTPKHKESAGKKRGGYVCGPVVDSTAEARELKTCSVENQGGRVLFPCRTSRDATAHLAKHQPPGVLEAVTKLPAACAAPEDWSKTKGFCDTILDRLGVAAGRGVRGGMRFRRGEPKTASAQRQQTCGGPCHQEQAGPGQRQQQRLHDDAEARGENRQRVKRSGSRQVAARTIRSKPAAASGSSNGCTAMPKRGA